MASPVRIKRLPQTLLNVSLENVKVINQAANDCYNKTDPSVCVTVSRRELDVVELNTGQLQGGNNADGIAVGGMGGWHGATPELVPAD